LSELARPAVAAPVTVDLPAGGELTVTPEVIAASLRLTSDARGEIVPRVDPEALREGLADRLARVERQPVDAHFVADGGPPRIVEEVDGELVELERLADDLLAVLPAPEPRRVAATTVVTRAEVTAADLAELGGTEQVSTFTTSFDGGLSERRGQNIGRGVKRVEGAVVRAGGVWSHNGQTG